VWFKSCAAVQAFEPRLTVALADRSPALLPQVIAHDEQRAWLLLADAGVPVGQRGNPPKAWLDALPRYAELQMREAAFTLDHLTAGVPDLRLDALPERHAGLVSGSLPLTDSERLLLTGFAPTFRRWCRDLAEFGLPATVQHDDLHHNNLYLRDGRALILDWGDTSIGHPFESLVVTFQFLESVNGLDRTHRWFARLRDAYLEPWGREYADAFELALRVGTCAHAIAWIRQRDALPASWLPRFDTGYRPILDRLTQLALLDK